MISKDEKLLRQAFGKRNPFRVPDGYFENFTLASLQADGERLTAKNAASGNTVQRRAITVPLWRRYRKAIAGVAASVCVGALSLGAYLHAGGGQRGDVSARQTAVEQHSDYSGIDAMMNYSMMDTEDMYAYMADLN